MPRPEPRWSRLAPSPTGALHLGNARTFLINAWSAAAEGWPMVLRVDDLDGPRVKPGAAEAAVADLAWLGIPWTLGPVYESHVRGGYLQAREALIEAGLIYPCKATRRDLEAASAPNEGDMHDLRYPGLYHPDRLHASGGNAPDPSAEVCGWRLRLDRLLSPQERRSGVEVPDRYAGRRSIDVDAEVGDFIVWTKQDVPAYQLAVLVDDLANLTDDAGLKWPTVGHVVRGNDLLSSTARQILVHRALRASGFPIADLPRWWHVPLVRGPDGRRLAKRHGDTRLATLRALGVSPERVVGLLAWWCGLLDEDAPRPVSFEAAARLWNWSRLPREDVVFRGRDRRWLEQER